MVRKKQTELHRLCMFYPDQMKASGIKTFQDLKNKFIKNGKFVRFYDNSFRRYKLCNFNIAVAELLLEKRCISKTERLKQSSLYSYRISGWNHRFFKKHGLTYLGEAIDRCIDKKGSFKPIGGKDTAIATNHRIAEILNQTGFLSEKEFLKVRRPIWKNRKLTDKELGESKDVVVNISKWPYDTKRILSVLWKRRHNFSWDRYQTPTPEIKSVTIGFLAEEFIRITPYDDIPIFKSRGHRLNHAFAPTWTDRNLDEALEIVEKTLRENNLLP